MQKVFRTMCHWLFALIVAALVFPANGLAQEKKARFDSTLVAHVVDTIAVKLALSDSQKVKVEKVFADYTREFLDIFQKYSKDREIFQMMRENVGERRDRRLNDIFDAKQRSQFALLKPQLTELLNNLRERKKEGAGTGTEK